MFLSSARFYCCVLMCIYFLWAKINKTVDLYSTVQKSWFFFLFLFFWTNYIGVRFLFNDLYIIESVHFRFPNIRFSSRKLTWVTESSIWRQRPLFREWSEVRVCRRTLAGSTRCSVKLPAHFLMNLHTLYRTLLAEGRQTLYPVCLVYLLFSLLHAVIE